MLKVFGFVRRNARLTHDEYRTGHVGYHNSFGRRLNNIRGYLLNVRANAPFVETVGSDVLEARTIAEPQGFDELWDGWGQLLFDSLDHYLAARTPARDRAGPDGLGLDPNVAKVGDDFDHLYGGSPFQFHVDEYVIRPVERPERKLLKVVQFVKRNEALAPELFRSYLTGGLTKVAAQTGLHGMVVNFRTPLDVMTGFFPPDAEGFTEQGTAIRERFYASWDCMIEYWLAEPVVFSSVAISDQALFARSFYREVDETVAVLPNRSPAPNFYFR